jgi:hypothetical protein
MNVVINQVIKPSEIRQQSDCEYRQAYRASAIPTLLHGGKLGHWQNNSNLESKQKTYNFLENPQSTRSSTTEETMIFWKNIEPVLDKDE